MKLKYSLYTLLTFFTLLPLQAKDDPTAKEAKKMFMKVYDMTFGDQGSTLTYSVNIIGIYKTAGTIFYKGKKFQYEEDRHSSWQDGVTAYMVDHKKKVVSIYRFDDEEKDSYLNKFKFEPENYNYSYKQEGNYYIITAKVKNSSLFGIKYVEAKVQKKNLYPVSLSIKLAFMRTTVKISNYRSGNISDNQFVFPKSKFKDYKYEDHRNKK